MLRIDNNPSGEAYRRLIDYAITHASFFVLAERGQLARDRDVGLLLRKLRPYLLKTYESGVVMGTNAIGYTYEDTIYVYRCCPEVGELLKSAAGSLFDWQHPKLPEDLGFWDGQERDWLVNIAHERMASLQAGEEEAARLREELRGVFLRGAFNQELEPYLADALHHGADRLYLSGFRLQEVPDGVGRISTLKLLEIFEQDIRRLPASLFDLEQLEQLTIYTADLEAIPPEIGRLTNLTHLTIGCCSYDRPQPGEPMISIEDVTLQELPAEIGRLTKLESLRINATGLRRLPPELAELKQLKYLDLSRNRLEAVPHETVRRLRQLTYKSFDGNPLDGESIR
ncbi:leucine-rich repeat domain-containing protein [Paenibacillus puerhi]|uniref:leucine-rich repeat domain-containing protein n=1 Tax=Paenibacillus puerhi TaxID=2692622 RepID=UPI0013589A9C|nr:leucine-rich repeat domain-containing protein [Paenibacillus puerhi]